MDRFNGKIARNIVLTVVLILVIITLFVGQLSLAQNVTDTLPKAIALRSESGLEMTFDETAEIVDASAVHIKKGEITNALGVQAVEVNVLITDEKFGDIMPFDFVDGNYFIAAARPLENKFAVISDVVAINLFRRETAVGQLLTVDDEDYIICGVYREKTGILNQLSTNGLDTVYLPYNSNAKFTELPAHLFYVNRRTKFYQNVLDDITAITGKSPGESSSSNYNDTNIMVWQGAKITVFVAGIVAAIAMLIFSFYQCKRAYFMRTVNKRSMVGHTTIAAVGAILAIAVLVLVCFPFYIPSTSLPVDNIFDVAHYVDIIIKAVNENNGSSLYDVNWNYSLLAMGQNGVLVALEVVLVTICGVWGCWWVVKKFGDR